ncbi:hypothetical protein HFO27_13435 [Rhizobium leguminosarum]|uniref:hypothetical protein n=1 Tax=Rhizobium leguminosarum TaxID=384 RepID=UPI001C904349|nr:hypothetical protein [Rhizobium leguminosarum]MBY3175634.1 hypothetical protein [Rhizobium leguminosarum]
MAFSGLHVVCAFPGSAAPQIRAASLLGRPIWSETLATAGTTTNASPGVDPTNGLGDTVFHVLAAADAFVAVGPTPNASTGPRVLAPAGEFVTIYVAKDDKLAWIAA